MKRRALIRLAAACLGLIALTQVNMIDLSSWEPVATGVEYREFTLPDPNNVYVARMDRQEPSAILESSIAKGKLASGRQTVSGMYYLYNESLNYWGQRWGSRDKVVVAINGYFFDPATGVPQRGQVYSSWYAKRFDNHENGSGFAWKMDRSAFIGECVTHKPGKQFITFLKSGETQALDDVNAPRGEDQLILYTPQYDRDTNTNEYGAEVLVEMNQPDKILRSADMVTGIVREIRKNQGSSLIPYDYVVLSAHGTAKTRLLSNVEVGDEIGITQSIQNCDTSLDFDWADTYASIGGSFYFLKDGVIQHFPDNAGATYRHPRTAIAFNDQYIFFIVVDGRDPENSVGMTTDELAAFAKGTLGATYGIAQDGGGSSAMVVNGKLMNNPSDPCYQVFLPVMAGTGSGKNSTDQGFDMYALPPSGKCQRQVANGMLMVVQEPVQQSAAFAAGDQVVTLAPADVLLGPGSNYGVVTTVPENTKGVILQDWNKLDGVLAKMAYWWKVDFSGTTGWVKESLIKATKP